MRTISLPIALTPNTTIKELKDTLKQNNLSHVKELYLNEGSM